MTTWQTEVDAAAVADTACRLIGVAARQAIAERGRFRLVLAGGGTPRAAYTRLAASSQSWKRWSLYYGDERCLPAEDPERNSQMVTVTGLAARAGKHYPIAAELGGKPAAAKYRAKIAAAQPFDMVLLGMGEDGHTASLFPGLEWPDKTVFAVTGAPKPPPERVTLGVAALQNCRSMLVMVTGESKVAALRQWRTGADLPIARVSAVEHALVLVERKCLELADNPPAAPSESAGQNT
ncbi:MAG: 6-phosphogluconolactonase [Sedimenticolaceae bacterium]